MKILHHPTTEDLQISAVLYALSDPVRLLVASEIRKAGEQCCGSIDVPVVKSTLSHHIRTLREAGVVHVRAQGTQRHISLRTEDLEERFPGLLTTVLDAFEQSEERSKLLQPE
ncbi:helix-turn-helix domain-containing protein [Paenibacillus sp. HB172176]|uniref:ArsR/SmtB family transcription factor n=1 Tax=Paenibacillus sp. HB172176 TaxID=2493690 RepID=UPI0014392279|nr:helix-turn-helix domain-containing protein [Paenibacillus sp. HB172176]